MTMFDDKEFNNHFKYVQRLALFAWLTTTAFTAAVVVFVGWVVVMLLRHFGVS